eukprot:TRINITY_DN1772_c3_g1_i1.p1 TRINITY_DN1772_c3_g1~~TRINITY_DN1772_c3_g1_i1.p1  ORF type:complete len:656 (+),score=167.54 TRINITY_DN1772_c3_g1_i1:41-1969(+)
MGTLVGGADIAIPALRGEGPKWQKEAAACNGCMATFNIFLWRHHCRACGLIYCDDCCPKPGGEKERVCNTCMRLPVEHGSLLALWDIGRGTFGMVKAGLLPDGRWCAIKCIEGSEQRARDYHKEVEVMKNLSHPNIVNYLGSHLDHDTRLYIFLEYVSGGALSSILQQLPDGCLPLEVAKIYTSHIVQGLVYLHKNNIAHRDIKCENILVCFDTGTAKVGDFGSAWKNTRKHDTKRQATTFVGTPHWMAPEVLRTDNDGYDAMKADVWSLGCTVIEMTTGKPAWDTDLNPLMLMAEMEQGGMPTSFTNNSTHLPYEARSFIGSCFERNPSKRVKMADLSKHTFVQPLTRPPPRKTDHSPWGARRLYKIKDLDEHHYLALLSSGEVVTVKSTVADRETQEKAYTESLKEISLLKEHQHKHIVGFYGFAFSEVAATDQVELKLFFEFVTGGTLDALLEKMPSGCLPDSVVRVYTRHMLQALVYLHDKGIAHRNLDVSTVLVSQNTGMVKLANFTEATDPFTRSARQKAYTICGNTTQVIAPEVIEKDEYDPTKQDIWALGCVVAEMHTGKKPWTQYPSPLTMLYAIVNSDGWPDCIDATKLAAQAPDLADFLSQCFQRKPDRRASAAALLHHSYTSLRSFRYEM